MTDYRVTKRRSLLAMGFEKLVKTFDLRNKLNNDSYEKLQALQDAASPVKRRFKKQTIAGTVCFWVSPPKEGRKVLIYLAGGGFIIGPSRLHWDYCESLASKLDLSVLLIRYPLAPQHPFPQGLDAVTNVITTLQSEGVLGNHWLMAGDSAGGNLTVATCYKLHERKAVLPEKIILLFPVLDMSGEVMDEEDKALAATDYILSPEFTNRVKEAYWGSYEATHPFISPIFGNLGVLPPMLILQGNHDILVKGTRDFVQKMKELGKPVLYEEYEGMFHGFLLLPLLPEAKQAFISVENFVKGYLK
jgi:monoterpene epsilon-lactone hydrolase